MSAQGTTTVNFGAFPGEADTSVAVTGQGSILSGSLVEVWIYPSATSDHSADEHVIDPPYVVAGNISAGVGFTIYAFAPNLLAHTDYFRWMANQGGYALPAPLPYGQWTVAWCWN